MKKSVYEKRVPPGEWTREDDLWLVNGKVVTAGFLSAAIRLGKVDGLSEARRLNRKERRALVKRRRA